MRQDGLYPVKDGVSPIDGEPVDWYPSVTTIKDYVPKPYLEQWRVDKAVEHIVQVAKTHGKHMLNEKVLKDARFKHSTLSKEATDFGSLIHSYCEMYFQTSLINTLAHIEDNTPEGKDRDLMEQFMHSLDEFAIKHEIQLIASEQTVYGDGYAGTLDMRCIMDSKKSKIDFKTGKKVNYPDWGYQFAAYYKALPTEQKPEVYGSLRFNKLNGKVYWKDFTKTLEYDYKIFLTLRDLYWLMNINKIRKGPKT